MSKVVRDLNQGALHEWDVVESAPLDPNSPVKAVIFIHGILSDHTRFRKCYAELSAARSGWRFFYVDYDYHAPLVDNGSNLAATLDLHFRPNDEIILVGHSMGGLLIRLACLLRYLPFVRMVFLLGTPNHGAFRTSSLGILMEMTRAITGKVWGLRPRKVGIFDLTRVTEIMKDHLGSAWRTASIDYVSIPGRYFHPQRGTLDHRLEDTWKIIFGGLDAGFELARAFLPILSIQLERAHDGIVEEASNSLIPEKPERPSEKKESNRRPYDPGAHVTYAHIVPDSAVNLVHVEIPDDEWVISIVSDIIGAESLENWLVDGAAKYHDVVEIVDHNSGRLRASVPTKYGAGPAANRSHDQNDASNASPPTPDRET